MTRSELHEIAADAAACAPGGRWARRCADTPGRTRDSASAAGAATAAHPARFPALPPGSRSSDLQDWYCLGRPRMTSQVRIS